MRKTRLGVDPRYFQIAALAAFLCYGCTRLGFEIGALQIKLTLATAVVMQLLLASLTRVNSPFDVRSALITGLSLNGLETWLTENGYKIPPGASSVLDSYIKQNLRFFVAKVNLQEKEKLGFTFLRPLQMAYESSKFMLPIRLGTVNANGPQELFVFALSRQGRVETTNYRTVKLNSDVEVPLFVKDDFSHFYRSMFDRAVQREDMRVVFLEYAWDMGWCDPCAAEPLSNDELRKLGVFWLEDTGSVSGNAGSIRPIPQPIGGTNVFITRLHLRYDSAHFPEDLAFQQTGDRTNFQGRYILRHPWTGEAKCDAARAYVKSLDARYRTEAENLANLTGWDLQEIYKKMNFQPTNGNKKWWQKIWE